MRASITTIIPSFLPEHCCHGKWRRLKPLPPSWRRTGVLSINGHVRSQLQRQLLLVPLLSTWPTNRCHWIAWERRSGCYWNAVAFKTWVWSKNSVRPQKWMDWMVSERWCGRFMVCPIWCFPSWPQWWWLVYLFEFDDWYLGTYSTTKYVPTRIMEDCRECGSSRGRNDDTRPSLKSAGLRTTIGKTNKCPRRKTISWFPFVQILEVWRNSDVHALLWCRCKAFMKLLVLLCSTTG